MTSHRPSPLTRRRFLASTVLASGARVAPRLGRRSATGRPARMADGPTGATHRDLPGAVPPRTDLPPGA